MKHQQFRGLLAQLEELTRTQKRQVVEAVTASDTGQASITAIEMSVDEARICPHCQAPGAIARGRNNGLRRYQCKACRRTFNAVTGTPLQGLHHKERWLDFGACLAQGVSVRTAAEQCDIAVGTAFQWRHRFLAAVAQSPDRLDGIVEADETFMLRSFKGQHNPRTAAAREPRKRGGKASTRGRSAKLVPMLFATDRSGATASHSLETVNVANLIERLRPMLQPDALLVSDANPCYPRVAQALGVVGHEAINQSAGERVRGALHIQTVNSRHSEFKLFLKPFRGIATSYLDSYLRWNHLLNRQGGRRRPQVCLRAAVNFC